VNGAPAVLVARAQGRDAVARMTAGSMFALTPRADGRGPLNRPSHLAFKHRQCTATSFVLVLASLHYMTSLIWKVSRAGVACKSWILLRPSAALSGHHRVDNTSCCELRRGCAAAAPPAQVMEQL